MKTEFLYPIRLELNSTDLVWIWALFIHTATLLISIFLLTPWFIAGITICLSISLRLIWDCQSAVRKSSALFARSSSEWFLERRNGDDLTDQVLVESITEIVDYVIIKVERFGSACYVIQHKSEMSDEQAHKFRLLALS